MINSHCVGMCKGNNYETARYLHRGGIFKFFTHVLITWRPEKGKRQQIAREYAKRGWFCYINVHEPVHGHDIIISWKKESGRAPLGAVQKNAK